MTDERVLDLEERLMYTPALWLVIGLILGWLLCKGGIG